MMEPFFDDECSTFFDDGTFFDDECSTFFDDGAAKNRTLSLAPLQF